MGPHVLGDLTLVVREFQVHATAMDVEGAAEVFGAHHGALEVPSREAHAPRRGPAHEVAVVGLLPQGEVEGVLLLVLAVEGAGLVLQLVNAASAEGAIIMGLGEFPDVEVDASIGLVGVSILDDGRNHLDLLHDVTGGRRLDGGGQDVEHPHDIVEVIGVALDDLHRFDVFEARLLPDFVFAVIGVAREVTDIRDVPHVAHLVAEVKEIAEDHIEGQEGPDVAQVDVAVHRGAAHVHAHVGGVEGLKAFLLPAEGIADVQLGSERREGVGGMGGVHVWAFGVDRSPVANIAKQRPARTMWRTGLLGQVGLANSPTQSASSRMS